MDKWRRLSAGPNDSSFLPKRGIRAGRPRTKDPFRSQWESPPGLLLRALVICPMLYYEPAMDIAAYLRPVY